MQARHLYRYSPLIGIIALTGLFLSSCGDDNQAFRYDRRAVLNPVVNAFILPTIDELLSQSNQLTANAQSFCSSPNLARLQSLQDAWRSTRLPLKRLEAVEFGPVMDLRIQQAIDFWPARTESIELGIQDTPQPSSATIEALGVAAKGFPAMEYLLFPPNSSPQQTLASLSGNATGTHRCSYLQALATNAQEKVEELQAAWLNDYATTFIDAAQAGVDDLINEMINLTETMAETKLAKPFGLNSGGELFLDELESRFSGHSLREVIANQEGLLQVYNATDNSGQSLRSITAQGNPTLADNLQTQLQQTLQDLQNLPEPLVSTGAADPTIIEGAFASIKNVQRLLNVDLTVLLSVTVTFNDNDGD